MGGRDRIFGYEGNDVLIGDSADTTEGLNTLFDDAIDAGPGNDLVHGGNGSDLIWGWDGADRLFGERGRDYLVGGYGPDYLSGGEGPPHVELDKDPFDVTPLRALDLETDEVLYQLGSETGYQRRSQPIIATLDGLPNDGQAGEGDFIASDVEGVEGGDANDVIVGDRHSNVLYGLGGDDTLIGGGGPYDAVYGGGGSDLINLFDGSGRSDPSGSVAGRAVPVGEFDDLFSCDVQGTVSGPPGTGDRVIADWEDLDADSGATVGCEQVVEPAQLVSGPLGDRIPVPVVCAGSRRCTGMIRLTWRRSGDRQSASKRFSFHNGRRHRTVLVSLPKALKGAGRHLRLRVKGRTPALEIKRRHRVRLVN